MRHCGHPTAIYPYHAETPEGRMVVSHNGRWFRNLETAMVAAETQGVVGELVEVDGLLCVKRYVEG